MLTFTSDSYVGIFFNKISVKKETYKVVKTFDILLHSDVVSVEILRLETTHFQKYVCMQEIFAML